MVAVLYPEQDLGAMCLVEVPRNTGVKLLTKNIWDPRVLIHIAFELWKLAQYGITIVFCLF